MATRARPERHEEVSVRICQSRAARIILLVLYLNVIGCPLPTSRWEVDNNQDNHCSQATFSNTGCLGKEQVALLENSDSPDC